MDDPPILLILLIMAAAMGFVLFLIKVTVPRIFNNVLNHYGQRLELAEQIINTRRAPEVWLTKQLALLEQPSDPKQIARIQARAEKISQRNMEATIKFLARANVFDTPATKRQVLSDLKQIQEEWKAKGWDSMEPDTSYVRLRDRDSDLQGTGDRDEGS